MNSMPDFVVHQIQACMGIIVNNIYAVIVQNFVIINYQMKRDVSITKCDKYLIYTIVCTHEHNLLNYFYNENA